MDKKTDNPRRHFGPEHFGLLLMAVGVALMLGFGFAGRGGGVAAGFVTFAVGLTFLGFSF